MAGLGNRCKAMLGDITVLTSSQVVGEELGIKLEDVTPDMLGRAKRIRVDGAPEVEVRECKDRVEDAKHATWAAVEIVRRVLQASAQQISTNAGMDGSIVSTS